MTRTELQDKLSEQFGLLGAKLNQLGAENRNIYIPEYEKTVCRILNLILDTNLTDDPDSPCKFVTAADRERRVAAEIRTTMNTAAIQKTLDLFSKYTQEGEFDRLIILVLTFDTRVIRDPFNKPFFKPQEDLWNLQTLFTKVSALENEEKVERISRYLDKVLNISFERPENVSFKLPEHVLPTPPPGTSTFVGREPELSRLRRMLSTQKHIVISGDGGIGKTELALRMAQLYAPPKGAYFIRYEDLPNKSEHKVIRNLILRAHFSGYQYSGQDNDSRDQEYAERLDILRNEYRDALLIIDNFDLSKKGMYDAFREEEFRDLVSTGAYLVFTTRYETPESLHIRRMDTEILVEFMRMFLNDMQVEKAELEKLIELVDGHTFTVELMARTMGQSWGLIDPDYFLEKFLKLTNDPDSGAWHPDVSTVRNGLFESRNIYGHICAVFDVSRLSDLDQCILRYASLLPVNGMDRKLFRNAVADCEEDKLRNEDETGRDNIINSITARGWLHRENDILTIHPVVRLVCRYALKPTYDNCRNFLDALWTKYNTRDYDKENFRQLAELFEMASEILEDHEGICALRAGLFWHRLGKLQKALDCYQVTVDRQEKSETNEVDLVRTYNKIGSAYLDLGRLEDARKNFDKAMEMAEKNPDVDQLVLAATYANVGRTLGDEGKNEEALKYRLNALDIRKRLLPADHPSLASSYSNVGRVYFDLGDYTKALEYNLIALEIRKRTGNSDDDLNLATSYNNVGGIYMHMNAPDKALSYLQKALAIREQILPSNHPALATSYNNVGGIYMQMNAHDKALSYLQKALAIREQVLPSNHPDLATSYNNVGILCTLTKKEEQGLDYLLKALENRKQVLSQEHPDIAETCNNIAMTYFSMEQYESALEYIMQAIAIAEKTLPPEHPRQAIYRKAENFIRLTMNM